MASYEFLDTDKMGQIAEKVAPFMWMSSVYDDNKPVLAESLKIYSLAYEPIQGGTCSNDCLQPENRWHIQIKSGKEAKYFARVEFSDQEWKVVSVNGPGLAPEIDKALDQIDKKISDEWTVGLLEIPVFFITGLVLQNKDDVLVWLVRAPNGIYVPLGQAITLRKMCSILQNQDTVQGVTNLNQ